MNEKEKLAYLKALLYIATIDEDFDSEEEEHVINIGNIYGISKDSINELISSIENRKESLEDILSEIKERKSKLSLLYELIYLCYVDGNYSDKEKLGIKNITKTLNIEDEKIEEIESLVKENFELQQKINLVLSN